MYFTVAELCLSLKYLAMGNWCLSMETTHLQFFNLLKGIAVEKYRNIIQIET
jgi:hypothetical protein